MGLGGVRIFFLRDRARGLSVLEWGGGGSRVDRMGFLLYFMTKTAVQEEELQGT